jgi:hypothetical protein
MFVGVRKRANIVAGRIAGVVLAAIKRVGAGRGIAAIKRVGAGRGLAAILALVFVLRFMWGQDDAYRNLIALNGSGLSGAGAVLALLAYLFELAALLYILISRFAPPPLPFI